MGVSVVEVIQRYKLPDVAIRLKEGMVVLLGGLCAYMTVAACRSEQVTVSWGVVALPIVLTMVLFARKGVSALFLVSGVVVSLITLFQVVRW